MGLGKRFQSQREFQILEEGVFFLFVIIFGGDLSGNKSFLPRRHGFERELSLKWCLLRGRDVYNNSQENSILVSKQQTRYWDNRVLVIKL